MPRPGRCYDGLTLREELHMSPIAFPSLRSAVLVTYLVAGVVLLAACAPTPPPAKPTEAPTQPAQPAVSPAVSPSPAASPASGGAAPSVPAARPAAAPSGKPFVVGGTLALSGGLAGEASAFQKLAEAWAEMVNESGG